MEKVMQGTRQKINEVISWLQSQGLPVLPVAPAQNPYEEGNYKVVKENLDSNIGRHCPLVQNKPIPKFTGKNPSYLDPSGLCQLVNHKAYQSRLPSQKEIELWYANGANGIGTLGGWNNTIWLDFDTKQFPSQEACDTAVLEICELIKSQTAEEPFLERSHSGGWHVGVRVEAKPNFTNFALAPGGKHVGEALGEGRFVVLAPTIGPSGKAYESINRCDLPVVESLESIGIYPTGVNQSQSSPTPSATKRITVESYVPNVIPLESLGNELSRQILEGASPTGDRSESLATAIKEWYGWENWARANNVAYSGTTEQLAEYAGGQLGIDADRIGRILKTVDPDQCHPAALSKGSEESCWKKIRRLSKSAFQVLGSVGRPSPSKAPGNTSPGNTPSNAPHSEQKLSPYPSETSLIPGITSILEMNLSEPEQRQELIGFARRLGLNRTDIESIASEMQIQSDRLEDLKTDSKQFQKLVNFRNQDLDLFRVFPRPLATALLSKAESSRLDPIRLVQNLLPACGTMLGNHVQIIAKYGATPLDHWYEAPAFWCADVSSPSSGKTDAQRAMFAPLKWIESQEYARVEEAKKRLAQLEERWKAIPKEQKADLVGTESDPEEFKKNNIDNQRRYLWDEVTTEALFKLVSKQPANSGSCLLKDELEALFLGMDQFKSGKGNGIQQLLSAWSGPLTGSVDRVDETKSYRFNRQTLNVAGTIQPDVVRNRLNVSSDPDGFTSRVLFSMSKLPKNFTKWSDVEVDLFSCIKGLLEGLEQMEGTLEYSSEAYKLAASQWETLKRGYLHYLESNPAYAYFLGKQNSYIHRFALLLHCLEHYYQPKENFYEISTETLKKAIILSDYYCGQFRLLQAISAKPDQPQLDGLLYRVWEKVRSLGKFSTRELCHFARRQKWRGEKMTAAAALDILKTIASCGFGKLKDKTLYCEESSAPPPPIPPIPPVPPDPVVVTSVTEIEQSVTETVNDCGQCGQLWSDCPQVESITETEIDVVVVNCGQGQDTQEIDETHHPLIEEVPSPSVEVEQQPQQTVEEVVEAAQEIVVGSRVYWDKCPGHWDSWPPFVVEYIREDGMVKLEIVRDDYLVPLSELRLAK
jgi:hypothetical protein